MFKKGGAIGMCAMLAGCAALPPNATIAYFLPEAQIYVTVSETASCSALNITTSFKPAAVISYESSGSPYLLRFNDFSAALSDTDMTVNLTSDGRLQGINAATTGEAATVAKSAADLSSSLEKVGASTVTAKLEGTPLAFASGCPDDLSRHGGSVTIAYGRHLKFPRDLPNMSDSDPLSGTAIYDFPAKEDPLEHTSVSYFRKLRIAVTATSRRHPLFRTDAGALGPDQDCASASTHPTPAAYVCLRNTADLVLSVKTVPGPGEEEQEVLTETHFVVPVDQAYSVPLPKPAPFGKAMVKLSLDPAGGLTSIGFARTSGVAEVLETGAALGAIAAIAATH